MSTNYSHSLRSRLLLAAFVIAAAAVLLSGEANGQDASGQDVPTYKVSVNVVNVLASVRNRNGDIIKNLTKDDFLLEEDGRPQTIKYFTQQTDLPLTMGLLVDISNSQRRLIEEERDASRVFLEQLLRPETDTSFVLHFARDVELLQDLTSSREKLERALYQVGQQEQDDNPRRTGWPGGRRGGRGGFGASGSTSLYDAVYLAANDVLARQSGRKAVIILSDGVDTSSKIPLTDAIEAAQRSDMIVYSILFADDAAYGGGFGGFGYPRRGRRGAVNFPLPQMGHADGKKVLQRLARETGGNFFEVSRKNSIGEIYAQIQEELRNQYNLGYTPDRAYDGSYRKIRVNAKQKGYTVQARDGYYAMKK